MAAVVRGHRGLSVLQLGLFDVTPDPGAPRGAEAAAGDAPAAGLPGRVHDRADRIDLRTPSGGAPDTTASGAGTVSANVAQGVPTYETANSRADAGAAARPSDETVEPAVHIRTPVEYVRHPKARRYLLRVRTDGTVRVTIPRRGSKREAEAFYEQHLAWVATQQTRIAELRKRLPADLPPDERRRLRRKAAKELPARLHQLAERVGLTVRRVSVRDQKHRWGSCSTSGLICLNWRLVTMPEWVRDYVIYHELMHLRRMDHSPAFWALVAEVCPNFREARRWLRTHALAPHAAGHDASA
ncbi:MAG: M48 family metallopeptidase [Vicinamibacterales bacterium]